MILEKDKCVLTWKKKFFCTIKI